MRERIRWYRDYLMIIGVVLLLLLAAFIPETVADAATAYEYHRSTLSNEQRMIYDTAKHFVSSPDDQGNVLFNAVSARIETNTVDAIILDHPEYFWLMASKTYKVVEGGKSVRLPGITTPYEADTLEIDLMFWEERVKALYKSIGDLSGKSTYYKIRRVYDYVQKRLEYKKSMDDSTRSLGRILATNKACCVGYARLVKLLLDHYGVPCVNVYSTYHEWNAVKLNGRWYLLDATWDDSGDSEPPDHREFLRAYDKSWRSDTNHILTSKHPALSKKDWCKIIKRGKVKYRLTAFGDAEVVKAPKKTRLPHFIKWNGYKWDVEDWG